MSVSRCSLLLTIVLALAPLKSYATNGINLIGYGAESTLLAGSDIATIHDTAALNSNPAGLANVKGQLLDIYGSVLRTTDLTHHDALNSDKHAYNRYTLLNGGGYAQQLQAAPCTVGIGLFVQGGAGAVYKNVNTPFGTGQMSSLFGIAKLTPGIACQVNDRLSLGAAVSLIYANIEQRFFEDISTPQFSGFKNYNAYALRTGIKLGMQYKLDEQWTLGAAYTSKTDLPLTNGSMVVNFTNSGLGMVKYNDMSIRGFALPQEVAFGIGYKPDDRWQLTAKIHWLNWSNAIKDITTVAQDPTNPLLAGNPIVLQNPQNWHDQWVYAIGASYRYSEATQFFAGYNHGKNPVPAQNASPLLAAFLQDHLTAGFSYRFENQWKITSGVEYLFPAHLDYNSPLFGNAQARNEGFFLHMMLSKQW